MSLNPTIVVQNWSRDSEDNLWGGNVSTAIGVFGDSSGQYGGVRTIGLCASGSFGLIARFNELATGSRQYYKFRLTFESGSKCAAIEEVNYSTAWNTPTIRQSRAFNYSHNTSFYASIHVQNFNYSQDRIICQVNGMTVLDWIGTMTLSAGKFGLLVQSGEARFDAFTSVGDSIDAYCSVNDVKKLLTGINVSSVAADGEILSIIVKASEKINDDTGAVFGRIERVVGERHDGAGNETILTLHRPIYDLHRVQIYNYNNAVSDDLTSGASDFDGLIIEKELGAITRPAKSLTIAPLWGVGNYPVESLDDYKEYDYTQYFGVGRRNILVSYSYGYLEIPREIGDACRKLVAIELLVKLGSYNTQGAAMIRLGDAMEDYRQRGSEELGSIPFAGTILKWQAEIDKVIKKYQVLSIGEV